MHRYKHKSPSEPVYSTRHALVLRASPQSLSLWPGDFVEVSLPSDCTMDATYALEAWSETAKMYRCRTDHHVATPVHPQQFSGKYTQNTQNVVAQETYNNPDKNFSSSNQLDLNDQLDTDVKLGC